MESIEAMQVQFDKILKECKNDRILDCLNKLKFRGKTLERSAFTKINKDTLSDSLIHIAQVLFGAVDSTRDQQTEDEDLENPFNGLHMQNKTTDTTEVHLEEQNKSFGTQTQSSEREGEPVCQLFLQNRCPEGIKGQNCSSQHPKQCKKFLQGGRFQGGCKNWECKLLHPKLCRNSYLFGSCQKKGCKERHLHRPQVDKNMHEAQFQGSFLWQKEMQAKMEALTQMHSEILLALSHNQPRPIHVWDRSSPNQSSTLPTWKEKGR